MNCPICDDTRLVISTRENIEIDYCPKCRGVWLDRGELDKIIDRSYSMRVQPKQTSMEYRKEDFHTREPQHREHKKRGSFLSDLFDFD